MSRAFAVPLALLAICLGHSAMAQTGEQKGDRDAAADAAQVTPLLQQDLDFEGKEVALLRVDYAPGAGDPVHRHDADVFVYVLSGSVEMQVRGGDPVTLGPGDTFTEKRSDIHVVGRNASDTEPASFLAFFVKDRGKPPVLPAE